MKIPKTYFGEYFKKSVLHLSKSKLIFLIISVIEFIEVLVCVLDLQDFFFFLNKNYYDAQARLSKILLSIIPYSYYFDYFITKDSSDFIFVYITILIYLFLFICFFAYLLYDTKESNEKIRLNSTLSNIIDKVCVNFLDLILFRLAPFYGINVVVREIFILLKLESYGTVEIVVLLLLILFLIFVISFTLLLFFKCVYSE